MKENFDLTKTDLIVFGIVTQESFLKIVSNCIGILDQFSESRCPALPKCRASRVEMDKSSENHTTPKRRYPPFYEKLIPFALAGIGVLIIVLLLIIMAVVFGVFPGR